MIKPRWISLTLSILGVIGVGVTSYASIKCHEKAKNKETKKEKIIAYAPAIASGIATSACILGSHKISRSEIAALSASCAYLASNRDKIEKKIREKYGENDLKEIKQNVSKETVKNNQSEQKKRYLFPQRQAIELTGNGKLKCFEGYSGRYFYSSLDAVMRAERILNSRLHDGVYESLNDFYELLGIEQTHFGHQFGWAPSEECVDVSDPEPITFENTLVEDDLTGETVLLIDVYTYPMEGWQEV